MAEGILGLGSGQAASLNQDLIDKLKAAEKKARVDPIETNIENIAKEKETFANIELKLNELLDTIKPFDLFVSGGVNAFTQKAATTSGSSVSFDAVDSSKLTNGITSVNIDTIAQKDVYQSNSVLEADKDTLGDIGSLSIKIGTETHTFNTADYATYDELATAINLKEGVNASFEEVGTGSYRMVLKSSESGIANKLEITGAASQALGFTTDGTAINATNHILTATDMKAFVDGIEYNVSSNVLNVDGLKITAKETGVSTINVSDDKAQIATQMQNFVTKYNELIGVIDAEINGADSEINDKSALRDVISQIKDKLFGQYGENDDKSIFNYGFSLDKNGLISLDNTKFTDALENNIDELKDMFIGSASKEGLGTQLKSTIDELQFTGGVISTYNSSMVRREETLKEDKTKAEESLDSKYQQLATQFGAYGAIINQFEAQFSGLKLMIQQSTAK